MLGSTATGDDGCALAVAPAYNATAADGVVDYIGNGMITEADKGQGDRGQSYSYAAASHGDWVYIGTMYGGLGSPSVSCSSACAAPTPPHVSVAHAVMAPIAAVSFRLKAFVFIYLPNRCGAKGKVRTSVPARSAVALYAGATAKAHPSSPVAVDPSTKHSGNQCRTNNYNN